MKLSIGYRVLAFLLGLSAFSLSARGEELFGRGKEWKFQNGQKEATPADPAAWRQYAYDDSQWTTVKTPVFAGLTVSGTELSTMPGSYTSVYLRRNFVVANPTEVARIILEAISDDGFIAWINGQEIVRYNMPEGEPTHDTTAAGSINGLLAYQSYFATNTAGLLRTGTNIIAIQAFSASLGVTEDFLFDTSLAVEIDSTPPIVEETIPGPGATIPKLSTIEVRFSEPVDGVEAEDLLINGTPATDVTEVALGDFLFSFPEPPPGKVTVGWRAAHGIVDRTPAQHPFAGGSWNYQLDKNSSLSKIIISEFMALNDKTIRDEDGDSSDWIEIANTSSETANLGGWFLTDDANDLTKWTFPDVAIPAQGYLLVFASGKNKTNNLARLHTNFKLSETGEYLALITPATNVASDFAPLYPKQQSDVSYGRAEGSPTILGYFLKPTPGTANSSSGPGFAGDVQFSKSGSTFTSAFNLTLSSADTNAVIRYTLNGTLPTTASTIYSSPIRITSSTQVRARAFTDGLLPGQPHSETFTLLNNNLVNFASDLPVLIINTLATTQPNASRSIFAHYSFFEPVNGRTSLTNTPTLSVRGGVKLRGSSTQGLAKSSFAVEFWDEFDHDENHSALGLPSDSDWVLYAPNDFEPILIHNPFMYALSRKTGMYSPRTRFVEVYLNKGQNTISSNLYNGIYVLEEKIKIGKNRVNIDKLEPENVNVPEVTGGYLMKVDRLDPGDTGFSAGGQTMAYIDPKEAEIKTPQRAAQRKYLTDYFVAFGKSLAATTWRNPDTGYAAYIDTASWVDFHILEVLSANVDAMRLSTYLHKPRNGKITYGPHWDFDRALGSTDGRDNNPRLWATSTHFTEAWWSRVLTDPDFWQKWIDRYQTWRQNELSTPNLYALMDELIGEIRQAQPREQAKWRHPLRGGTWQSEITYSKNWLSNHCVFLDQQFPNMPVLSSSGGKVSPGFKLFISSAKAPAVILYTLNGTDPRLSGGGISPSARTNFGEVTITANARIFARAYNATNRHTSGGPTINSPWSAPVAATFAVEPPPLIVAEIMFHPDAPAPGSLYTATDYEFIELKNIGQKSLNLSGYKFTRGIEFVFLPTSGVTTLPPGGRVLIVKNRAAFLTRYPAATGIAGEYTGALSNGGNRLAMVGPLEEPVFDFTYHDDWQPMTDGLGFSLVLSDETTAVDQLDTSSNWRQSANAGGSPGIIDPAPPQIPRVVINEALARPLPSQLDKIELYNDTDSPANVSGWFLTDDFKAPRKYTIATGTTLIPHGIIFFQENQFHASDSSGFGLSAAGDSIYLFSADSSGTLTGWYHGFSFGASRPGESFGRIVTSTGGEYFVTQTNASFGGVNEGPKIGPVILNEIMFNPPAVSGTNNTQDEYVELRNVSSAPVLLSDGVQGTNTWHLRGGISFNFPTNVSIPTNGVVAVVSFDPRTNSSTLTDFRTRYGLPPQTAIFGPWSGRLDNGGDSIRLLMPDPQPISTNDMDYILVEEVDYSPLAPWPQGVSGTGFSLHRAEPIAFANDPASWRTGLASPAFMDSDDDGLPDDWEIANGLNPHSADGNDGGNGDLDGDGLTNHQELILGTSPRDPKSYLGLNVERTSLFSAILIITGVPNRTFSLQSRDGLQASWEYSARTVTTDAQGRAAIPLALPTTGERFFRLVFP